MRWTGTTIGSVLLAALAGAAPRPAAADVLTVDQVVKMALERNTQIASAHAAVLNARSGVYGAYSGVLPHFSADFTRSGSRTDKRSGSQLFGTVVTPSITTDNESYSNTPSLTGTWSVLNLSSIRGLASARTGLKASQLSLRAARNDVAMNAKRQFYEVVKAIRLAQVSSNALALSRDNTRRVQALFQVGSVARSDLLKAQVATAQAQLDSINASQAVVVQRVLLASLIGVEEHDMGDVDTVLTVTPQTYDEASLLAEAARNRPDLQAADAELRSAKAGLTAARLERLPYVTVSGSATYSPKSTFSQKSYGTFDVVTAPGDTVSVVDPITTGSNKAERQYSGSIALNWDIFDGLLTDSHVASARARLIQAQDGYNVLQRNLAGEVHQDFLAYQQALTQNDVARTEMASAQENLKLVQQKYNVGSATILDLIDAQVQLQRAESDQVSALAGIREAEATLERARGRGGE